MQRWDAGCVSDICTTVETVKIGESCPSRELQFSESGRKREREHSQRQQREKISKRQTMKVSVCFAKELSFITELSFIMEVAESHKGLEVTRQ